MGRKIILLSDGTGNSAAKVWRTNVWRTFEALDLSGSDQVAYYDDGVGTSSFKPLAILGGAFGFGLKRNVIALYKFACRNFRNADDELFGFGFSRGAFTIRIVMGLILSEGLVSADNESDLHRGAVDAYRSYRRKHFHTRWSGRPEEMFRNIRDGAVEVWRRLVRVEPHPTATARRNIKIRFIGVWDTVAAYGLPMDEMTRGVSRWIWPLGLPNHQFDRTRIARGCQALALDEERTTFHPELWNERTAPPRETDITECRTIWDDQICQVWFAGVHSNVGGGYPDDSLAYIPFVWMITEAQRCGLHFKTDYSSELPAWPPSGSLIADPDTIKAAISKRDKDGRLYDPRKGLGGYYRYGPRKLVSLNTPQFIRNEDDEIVVERPKIHESVFKRIRNHAHAYAPPGLPPQYDVVTDDGNVLTPDQYKTVEPRAESNMEAAVRAVLQERVWNRIWWRKAFYYLSLAATLWLVAMPFVDDAEPYSETYSRFRWISAMIRFVGEWLPSFSHRWIVGYAAEPIRFLISAAVLAGLLWLGGLIAADVTESMSKLWRRQTLPPMGAIDRALEWLRCSEGYNRFLHWAKRSAAPALFAILFAAGGLVAVNKAAFVAYDSAGYTCVDQVKRPKLRAPRTVARGASESVSESFDIRNLCGRTRILLEGNARYRLTVKLATDATDQWRDGSYAVPPGGYSSAPPRRNCLWQTANQLLATKPWAYSLLTFSGIPLRRVYGQDWMRLVARIGSEGAEEDYYRPDPDDCVLRWVIKPKRGGELFIYVNDAVIGLPTLYDYFYQNNFGFGTLIVERL